jgi:hypothetical protein
MANSPRKPISEEELPADCREFYLLDDQIVVDEKSYITRICKVCDSKEVIRVNWVRTAAKNGTLSAMCRGCAVSKNSKARTDEQKRGMLKGGRYRDQQGYIHILSPNHPRKTKVGSGYVREHHLVMEKAIGRYLLPHENVHHKNGVRDDNRIENLELWTKVQPAGQKAEDMVQFAKEILALYADLPTLER